ncbi:hypothetical protein K5549_019871, partial [Capra hircus]
IVPSDPGRPFVPFIRLLLLPGCPRSPGEQRSPHPAWWPAPPTWGRGPSNDSVQRVGGGGGRGRGGGSNSSGDALVTRISSLLRDLPTLKAAVIVACAFTAFLIACLLLRVFRSGKRLKKTRKYDIITTPAERVEMAPLNEEDDEDEDSTVFDIKYR